MNFETSLTRLGSLAFVMRGPLSPGVMIQRALRESSKGWTEVQMPDGHATFQTSSSSTFLE